MHTSGRPKPELTLSANERQCLELLVARPTATPALRQRARIVLECARGMANTAVAASEDVAEHTVGKWRTRFVQDRLAGLDDAPRSGAPRTLPQAKIDQVVRLTVESKPPQATRWSTRSLAKCCGLTHDAVHRIWRAFGLRPHATGS